MTNTKDLYLRSEECKDANYSNNCFKKIELYEEKIGKDLLDFSKDEVLEFYRDLESPLGTIRRINNNLKHYMTYCVQHGYCNENVLQSIATKDMQACTKTPEQKYFNYGQVVQMASELMNPEDSFIFMAIYEGLLDEELTPLNAKISDIDIPKGKFKIHSGELLDVDLVLLKYAVESYNAAEYHSSNERIFYSESFQSDYIVKYIFKEDSRNDIATIYNRFYKIKNKLNCSNLSLTKLAYSGFIQKSLKTASLLKVDIYEFYKTIECEQLKKRYNIVTCVPAKINETYKRYLA